MSSKSLYEIIVETYPELLQDENAFIDMIKLRNDSNGTGDYIAAWNYSQPLPKGLKLGL
jgi:hypothetical protein